MNGSSATGQCNSATAFGANTGLSNCSQPTTSVLFDGNIPTLTGLDGDMWASELLVFQLTESTRKDIISDFTATPNYVGVRRVEIMMVNCPEWGIGVSGIRLLSAPSISVSPSLQNMINPTITSCDSLVRVCISEFVSDPVIFLRFFLSFPVTNRTYLAEMTFYGSGTTCPPDTIVTPPEVTAEITTANPSSLSHDTTSSKY